MSTHTPGPWEIETEQQADVAVVPVNVEGNGFYAIATMHGPEISANARLIAAAPDLLDVLKAFSEGRDPINRLSPQDAIALTDRVRAAIAKAEGVS